MTIVSNHFPKKKTQIRTQFERLHFPFLNGTDKSSVYHVPGRR
ncbi:hypothetical protein [Roseibium salinum]|uniref:Uncharacterized protein n=1 Tax=Roseibium salinum TaxID=1604349 RepID=A0ABT3R956_9HYPH|nr:hypothetical protein [Roseibium sp. DSM 29163]MCX2725702.1 hypothetical protein [Roseibium sp. DSM 29163]MDN3720543.1 hypothetical protein [Roseibium salinum]